MNKINFKVKLTGHTFLLVKLVKIYISFSKTGFAKRTNFAKSNQTEIQIYISVIVIYNPFQFFMPKNQKEARSFFQVIPKCQLKTLRQIFSCSFFFKMKQTKS